MIPGHPGRGYGRHASRVRAAVQHPARQPRRAGRHRPRGVARLLRRLPRHAGGRRDEEALYLRGIEERNHHSIVLRRTGTPICHALGYKVASEGDLDRAAAWFAGKGMTAEFRDVPFQGRTLRARDCVGMPIEFYARMEQRPSALQKYAPASRRAHPADRPPELLHRRRAVELRVLHRAGLPADRIHRDRRRAAAVLGGLDAPQRERARHRLHERRGAAPAPRRRLDGRRRWTS